jgi:hypothetical protein
MSAQTHHCHHPLLFLLLLLFRTGVLSRLLLLRLSAAVLLLC